MRHCLESKAQNLRNLQMDAGNSPVIVTRGMDTNTDTVAGIRGPAQLVDTSDNSATVIREDAQLVPYTVCFSQLEKLS